VHGSAFEGIGGRRSARSLTASEIAFFAVMMKDHFSFPGGKEAIFISTLAGGRHAD
jgi:formate hydrogenlyase subunit 4